MTIEDIGRWPVSGQKARAKPPAFYHIPRSAMLRTIYGKEHPIAYAFYVSNDLIHMGELVVPPGGVGSRASEIESHKGDEALYVQEGPIVVYVPETSEAYEVRPGETMYLPEGTQHQYINYTNHVVKGIFAIAPNL
jgi:mannose-6-phosphate isomerase-like protein (cupin superfamily)